LFETPAERLPRKSSLFTLKLFQPGTSVTVAVHLANWLVVDADWITPPLREYSTSATPVFVLPVLSLAVPVTVTAAFVNEEPFTGEVTVTDGLLVSSTVPLGAMMFV